MKLTVAHIVNKSLTFMQPKGTLLCSQVPTNEPYPKSYVSTPHHH